MTQVTHTQLQNLIDNSNLVVDEIYVLTDYPNYNLSLTAVSENELSDEAYSYSTRDNLVFHYVPSTNTVDYMKDTYRFIEGNFDWTDNINGNCYDIHLEDATGLIVTGSSNVWCEGTATGSVNGCQNIVIGDGSDITLTSSNFINIGRDNNLTLTGCSNIDIRDRNTLSLSELDFCSIENDNSELNLQGRNIIGSKCTGISIQGDSNIVRNGSREVVITGDVNTISDSLYIQDNGSFNNIEKVSLAQLDVACGNDLNEVGQVSVSYTNNNLVLADEIAIDHKEPFVMYQSYEGVKRVKDLTADINMRADNNATVLIADEQRMWNTPQTKDNKHYVIIDGVWTDVENI